MDQARQSAVTDEIFFSSSNSQVGKSRRWLWVFGLISVVVPLLGNKSGLSGMLFLLCFVVVILAVIDAYLRGQLKAGKPLVILNAEGIESLLFAGEARQYPWHTIATVSLVSNRQGKALQFLLNEGAGHPDKRNFWNGANPARPSIRLAVFADETQEQMLEAINRHLRLAAGGEDGPAGELINPIAEERRFQEQLKALAPIPWITYLMIASNVIIWGLTVAAGADITHAPTDKLLLWGANAASEVQRGEWWRLLTATFLHNGIMHVTMNMIGLAAAGITVERIYGHRLFTLIYLGSGLIGSALSLHFSAQHAVSVGASGAVFGVTGALLVAVFQNREKLPQAFGKQTISSLGFFIIYALAQGFSKPGIDNAAHIGGLLGGCLLAFLLPERFAMEHFIRTMRQRALAGLLLVVAATAGLAAIAPHAAVDQKKLFAGQAAFVHAMSSFASAINAVRQEQLDVQAGKLTERASDERSRSVFAPLFRQVQQEFDQAYLPENDPRAPLLRETRQVTALMLESLEMQSVFTAGSDKPEPADPERMHAIEAELQQSGLRVEKLVASLKAGKNR